MTICPRSCSRGCLTPSFAIVLEVVPVLKSQFVLAVAVVDDIYATIAAVITFVPD